MHKILLKHINFRKYSLTLPPCAPLDAKRTRNNTFQLASPLSHFALILYWIFPVFIIRLVQKTTRGSVSTHTHTVSKIYANGYIHRAHTIHSDSASASEEERKSFHTAIHYSAMNNRTDENRLFHFFCVRSFFRLLYAGNSTTRIFIVKMRSHRWNEWQVKL